MLSSFWDWGHVFVRIAADANHNGSIEINEQFADDLDVWGDFTNDGILDRVSLGFRFGDIGIGQMEWTPTEYYLEVYIGAVDGTLTLGERYVTASISPNAPLSAPVPAFGAADFNGDGKLDVVVGSHKSARIWLGQGNGTFLVTGVNFVYGMDYSAGVYVTDVNNDAAADVFVIWHKDGNLELETYLGHGDGTFTNQDFGMSGAGPNGVIMFADITQDGNVDIITHVIDRLQIRSGYGDGTFGEVKSFAAGHYGRRPRIADMDNDGRYDVVSPSPSPPNIRVMLNRCAP